MKRIFVIFLLIHISATLNAQKVAVVLSGGGSKGAAHIGVLRALEENKIPIDYICGTSIGAIVGGLYASGWTIDEMENLITSQEFSNWAKGTIDEKYVFYFKQPDIGASWASFRVHTDSIWIFDVPTNLVSSGQMDFIFMEIFAQANDVCKGNFDSLFVPFRCIGSNITDSKENVFRDGNLIQAIRASMTYPFYFKPITIDGKLYMDGGMFNNFPSDVALNDFDPDIIIGSKVAFGNAIPDPDKIKSQIENIFMRETSYKLPCNSSVLIEPEIWSSNVIDFSSARDFIRLGYDAALKKIPEIKKFVLDTISEEEISAKRDSFNNKKKKLEFSEVEINGLNKRQKHYALSYFPRKKVVSLERTRSSYYQLLTDPAFRNIYPISYSTDEGLKLNLDIKKEANVLLRFGGIVSSNPVNEAFAEISYKYLQHSAITATANMYAGRFYSSGLLGLRLDFPRQPQYAIFGRIIYNQWDYFRTTSHFFEDKNPSYLVVNDYHWDCGIILPAGNKGKISIIGTAMLLDDEYFQHNYFTRIDIPDRTSFRAWSTWIEWERNTLNQKQYANKGTFLKLKTGFVNGKEHTSPGTTSDLTIDVFNKQRWIYADFIYENYFFTYKKFIIGEYFNLHYSNKSFFTNYTSTILFAQPFRPLPEMNTLFQPQFRSHKFAGLGIKGIFKIKSNFEIRTEYYMFQPLKEITKGSSNFYAEYSNYFEKRYFFATGGLVFHSPVGPVALLLSYYEGNPRPFMLSFYFGFSLFNPQALH